MRVVASGVCHSDLHFVDGFYPFPTPAILGHEAAGIVEAVGLQVSEFAPGDHVIACLSVFCGHCDYCLTGKTHLCQTRPVRGKNEPPKLSWKGQPVNQFANLSAYAEKMLVHENALVKIDDTMPLDRAALIGCGVTTGVGAVLNTARIEAGSAVAVFGAGGVGLAAIQGARIGGARMIIAVDVVDGKLATAKELGATHTVNASAGDPVKAIRELTNGGVDYSFEAIGLKKAAEQCFDCIRARRHRDHRRHDPDGPEDRARRPHVPAREEGPGLQHGLEPLQGGHAPLHRLLPPGPPQARRDDHAARPPRGRQRGVPRDEGRARSPARS